MGVVEVEDAGDGGEELGREVEVGREGEGARFSVIRVKSTA